MKTLVTIADHILEHGTDATHFARPAIMLSSRFPRCCRLYVCGQLPPLAFSSVEKCYWQNDIDGINQLIEGLANEDTKVSRILFHKDSWVLDKYGIYTFQYKYRCDYGEIALSQITEGDIFIGVDKEGDLVYAKL